MAGVNTKLVFTAIPKQIFNDKNTSNGSPNSIIAVKQDTDMRQDYG